MNKRNIINSLSEAHKNFVDSIEDTEIKNLVSMNSFIIGGSIVSLLLNEKVNDYDIYFTDVQTTYKVAKYFVGKFNIKNNRNIEVKLDEGHVKIFVRSNGIAEEKNVETKDYEPVFLSSNAISLKGNIQIITRFYGTPEELQKNFDFEHTKCYFEPYTKQLVLPPKSVEAILTKQLIYTGSKYPVASMIRTKKFIKRGWQISAGQMLKIALDISKLNLLNVDVLEDQLTGVDAYYFIQLIDEINENYKNDSEFVLDCDYLISVIDKVFDD